MIRTLPVRQEQMTVEAHARRARVGQALWLLAVTAISAYTAYSMWHNTPSPHQIAWICFWAGVAAILYHPRNGVYILVACALVGDAVIMPWYPFNKNLSSYESLLFFSDGMSFSPLELTIAITFGWWIVRMAFQRKWEIRVTPLLWPLAGFTLFAVVGVLYGFSRGGDRIIGLWEARSIFYLLPVYLMTSSLIKTRAQVRAMLWAVLIPVSIDGLFGFSFVHNVLKWKLSGVESIGEHALSIQFNAFFVLMLALWMFRASYPKRIYSLLFVAPALVAYVANNRRAAFISLGLCLAIFAIVLFRRQRQRFWLIVPASVVLGVLYIAVFWSIDGPLGAPAQAVRSVIGEPDARDASSNLYRIYENFNIMFTIRSSPLFGLGFGHKFYRIMPLADISVFPFYEYIPHNSVLWIWIKMGLGGFFCLLLMVGMAIAMGTHTLWRMPQDEMGAAALLALSYIVIHFIFAYVDIAWDGPNMVMVGTMMGLIACLIPVVERPTPLPPKRWPWQPAPQPPPGIYPLPEPRPRTFSWW